MLISTLILIQQGMFPGLWTACYNGRLPSGPPEPPQGCSTSVGKARTLDIDCRPGFDGGLPQEFILSLVNTLTGTTVINKTAIIPTFSFKGGLISRAVSEPSRSFTLPGEGRWHLLGHSPCLKSFTIKNLIKTLHIFQMGVYAWQTNFDANVKNIVGTVKLCEGSLI